MKNSPGSMIGGIGLTICVRDVQFSRTIAMTSSTSVSSTPSRIVALDCLRKPAGAVQPGRPELLVEQGIDEGPGILVVDDGDDEFHRAEYPMAHRRRSTLGDGSAGPAAARRVRCALRIYRPACRSPPVSSDGPSRDPRAGVSAAIAAAARADDLDAALAAITQAGVDGLGASMGAVFLTDPDRAGLTLAASSGLPRRLEPGRGRPGAEPPVPRGRDRPGRRVRPGRRRCPTGATFVGAYLPLLVASGGVETSLGAIGFGWAAPHDLDDAGPRRPRRTWRPSPPSPPIGRGSPRRPPSAPSGSSGWPTPIPLTGLANERTVARILELELARAGRQGSEVSLAIFDVDDFRATNATDGHEVGDDILRRVAAVLAESVRLVDTVGRIGGDEFVLVAPGSAGAMVARRVQDGIAALPAVAGRNVSISAGVARFPVDGADSEALIEAAMAALARAKAAGAGVGRRVGGRGRSLTRVGSGGGSARRAGRDDGQGRGRRPGSGLQGQGQDDAGLRRQAGALERGRAGVADLEAAERHRHAVAGDGPRLVDLGAGGRPAGTAWPGPRRRTRRRPRARCAPPPSLAGVRTAVSDPGWSRRRRGPRRRRPRRTGRVESWFWRSRFQPPSRAMARTAAMRRTHVPDGRVRGARRSGSRVPPRSGRP